MLQQNNCDVLSRSDFGSASRVLLNYLLQFAVDVADSSIASYLSCPTGSSFMTLHCGCEAIQRRAHFAHGLSIRVANIERIWLATERRLHYDTHEINRAPFPLVGDISFGAPVLGLFVGDYRTRTGYIIHTYDTSHREAYYRYVHAKKC